MALASGTKLGPYEITAPLGAGGMGEVYRARDNRLGREVAIKVLPPGFSQDGDRLRRFEQEARAAGILNHPNILSIHDIGTIAGAPTWFQSFSRDRRYAKPCELCRCRLTRQSRLESRLRMVLVPRMRKGLSTAT
jgi:serine/threonine protein kinase